MKNAIAPIAIIFALLVQHVFAAQGAVPTDVPSGSEVFMAWLPMLGILVAWFIFMTWMKKGSGGIYDKQVKLAEENNALLKEILQTLKQKQ